MHTNVLEELSNLGALVEPVSAQMHAPKPVETYIVHVEGRADTERPEIEALRGRWRSPRTNVAASVVIAD